MLPKAQLKTGDYPRAGVFSGRGLSWGFSRAPDGNMSLLYADTRGSLDNRRSFLSGLDIDYRDLVCARQVHAGRVAYIKEGQKSSGALNPESALADTDALITDAKGVPLAVFTADCLAVFLYAPEIPAIGLAHAGWRGTQAGIASKTAALMLREFNLKPDKLSVFFGPAIRSCCYEVGEEFCGFFDAGITKRNGRYYFDLVAQNIKQLLGAGIAGASVYDCALCTCCREDFFSYRRQGASSGRMMSVAMLRSTR